MIASLDVIRVFTYIYIYIFLVGVAVVVCGVRFLTLQLFYQRMIIGASSKRNKVVSVKKILNIKNISI